MRNTLFLLFLILSYNLLAQNRTISGFVEDAQSGERLIGAAVYSKANALGVTTNEYGYFSLKVPNSVKQLTCSYIGYDQQEILLKSDPGIITIQLTSNNILKEVEVAGNSTSVNRDLSPLGIAVITPKMIEQTPAIFGEADILKTMQALPGVTSTKEGFAGLIVRGGSRDQNLILLDGVPIYNVSHLMGLFSVINPRAIQSATILKGAHSSAYGGRLSSVVDIRLKEGNRKELKGEVEMGVITAKALLEGPIDSKTSFCVSARRTLLDLLMNAGQRISDKDISGYYFGDMNLKLNREFSKKHRLYFSLYSGIDKEYEKIKDQSIVINNINYKKDFSTNYKWGNVTSALRWNYLANPSIFFNTTLIYSHFFLGNTLSRKLVDTKNKKNFLNDNIDYSSGITDVGIKTDCNIYGFKNQSIKIGLGYTNHHFKPGIHAIVNNTISQEEQIKNSLADIRDQKETFVYIEDKIRLFNRFTLAPGLRATWIKDNDYQHMSLNPQVSMAFDLTPKFTLNAAYSENTQYLHLLSSSVLELPTDLWIPASEKLPEETAQQYSMGFTFRPQKNIELSIEAYKKKMDNLLEYKEGSSILNYKSGWFEKTEIGKGDAKGIEFMLKKTGGKLNGWLAYTLSKSTRQFDNINSGRPFLSQYDRKHDLTIAANYQYNDRWSFSANWAYQTGMPYSIPLYVIPKYHPFIGGDISTAFWTRPVYTQQNNLRLPTYHRLDLAAHYVRKSKKRKGRTHEWTFGLYNAYGRKNVIYRGYTEDGFFQKTQLPFLPSCSYKYSF
ncbi:hypothetical protein EMN47_02415 [Prolixibacteraceae bacterium JC049]|nr:hypothetical protein [Prolixibacteraceae bacterium JC049]